MVNFDLASLLEQSPFIIYTFLKELYSFVDQYEISLSKAHDLELPEGLDSRKGSRSYGSRFGHRPLLALNGSSGSGLWLYVVPRTRRSTKGPTAVTIAAYLYIYVGHRAIEG